MGNSIVQLQAASIFQNNQLILKEVSIDVSAGEFVFLIGKTGTGKSSLIKTLYADLPLKEGMGLLWAMTCQNQTKGHSLFTAKTWVWFFKILNYCPIVRCLKIYALY